MLNLTNLYLHGRLFLDDYIIVYNTGSGFEFNALLKEIKIKMQVLPNQKSEAWMKLIIDNDYDNPVDFKVRDLDEIYSYSFSEEKVHNIKLLKASEGIESFVKIDDLEILGKYLDKPNYEYCSLIYGDSTVSAFGNLGHLGEEKVLFDTDGLKGYAYLTSKAFNLPMNSVNASGWGLCFSPWTTPQRRPLSNLYDKMGPLTDKEYDLKQVKPKFVIISLGTNDSFYIRDCLDKDSTSEDLAKEFKESYHNFLVKIKDDFGNVPVFMVYGLMNESHHYDIMHDIYLTNHEEFNLYECCILGDGLGISGHPTKESHKEVSEKLIEIIKSVLC